MSVRLETIFKEINSTNSVVEKEAILRKYKDDDYLAHLLYLNLSPYVQLQFNKMPCTFGELTSFDKFSETTNYKMFVKLCEQLRSREITGNEAKREVIDVFKRMMKEEFEIYSKILLKDAIGVGAKTVNKVWPKHIPEFEIMLAPNELPDITKVKYPAYIQPKLDGYRCVYREGAMWSRAGKPFGNKNLALHFKKLFQTSEYVLDGELYCHGTSFNSLQKILNTEEAPLPVTLKYVVYDCVHLTQWDYQHSKKEYQNRLVDLRHIVNGVIGEHSKVIDIANDKVNSAAEAVDKYKEYLKNGYEGAMLKAPDGLYRWKRTTVKSGEMLKVKPFKSIDLPIESIYAGEGKFEGMAGGVDCTFNGVTVSIGSGFDVDTRKKMAAAPHDYLGKTIEIKYFEETEDGSLRFPTFVRFREEKD